MSVSEQVPLKICPECGAENIALARRCWMCHGDVARVPALVTAEIVEDHSLARQKRAWHEWFFLWLMVLLAVVIATVGAGLASEEPWLLIPYAIIVVPGFVATAIQVSVKSAKGETVSWGGTLATFVISTAVAIGVALLLLGALFVAIVITCFETFPSELWS